MLFSCLLAVLSGFAQPPDVAPAAHADEMRWDKAEGEVGSDGFSRAFIDSLKQAHGVADCRGLRRECVFPVQHHEKLVYEGGWGVVRAGFAILSVDVDTQEQMIRFGGKVVSNNFVSTFYRVRDFVQSHVDQHGLYPLFFEQHLSEGRFNARRWTLFDHLNRTVYYKGRVTGSYPASTFTHDYISLLHYLRTRDMVVGDSIVTRCFVHQKDYPIVFRILKREKITVEAGTFSCLKVEPQLVGEGRGFTRRDQMYIWFTDDAVKMPVMIKAKINIGAVAARLLHYERN